MIRSLRRVTKPTGSNARSITVLWVRTISKWWSGRNPRKRRFIYLRTGQVWIVDIPREDDTSWTKTFYNEQAALDCIEATMKRAGGEWTYYKEPDK